MQISWFVVFYISWIGTFREFISPKCLITLVWLGKNNNFELENQTMLLFDNLHSTVMILIVLYFKYMSTCSPSIHHDFVMWIFEMCVLINVCVI